MSPCRAVKDVTARSTGDGSECRVRARVVIDVADPYLAGHFPGMAIYPGVFMIEDLRQAVSAGLGKTCHIVTVRSARFLGPLVPGDVLVLDAKIKPAGDGTLTVTAEAFEDREEVRVAKLRLVVRPEETADA